MNNYRIQQRACTLAFTWLTLQAQLGTGRRTAHGSTRAAAQVTEESYWQSRHAAELAWHARVPNGTRGTLLSIPGTPNVRFWDLYAADYSCPYIRVRAICCFVAVILPMPLTGRQCSQERMGKLGDGGKWVCGVRSLLQHPACLVYAAGSNGEPSFERALTEHTACDIHVFDHTLGAAQSVTVQAVDSVRLHDMGLAAEGALAKANMRALSEILGELQHQWIDVLKMDIEGAEWPLLESWYRVQNRTLPATQLLIEFHFTDGVDLESVVAPVFERLTGDGYRVFATEPNYYCGDGCCASKLVEYAFIKVSKHGHVVTGVNSHASDALFNLTD